MKRYGLFLVVAMIALIGTLPVFAQDVKPSTAQGQLMRVDSTAKTIEIKTASAEPMVFSYSDTTKVTGAGESVAGLATLEGTEVTVTYVTRGKENAATQIEVKKKPA